MTQVRTRAIRAQPRAAAHAGFTLIELMISLTIGLFILGALVSVLLGASAASKTTERVFSLQNNGRYALDLMKSSVQLAGFLGRTTLFEPEVPVSIAVGNVCDSATIGLMSQRIWGSDDANPYAATCIPAGGYAEGDVLVVRHLSSNPVGSTADPTRIFFHSSYERGEFFQGTPGAPPLTKTYLSAAEDYALEEVVYYISPYTTSPGENPRVPALYRVRLGSGAAGPAMVTELVASGVEKMQVRYGQLLPGAATESLRYRDAGELSASDWGYVVSAQISLLMRSPTREPGYVDGATYRMGNQTYTPNDGYRRLLMETVAQLRN